jgi:DNA-binding transcriptional LysR family regulator
VLPAAIVEEDLKSGRLVRLLAEYALPEGGTYALFPSREHLSTKVVHFIEILSDAPAESVLNAQRSQTESGRRERTTRRRRIRNE